MIIVRHYRRVYAGVRRCLAAYVVDGTDEDRARVRVRGIIDHWDNDRDVLEAWAVPSDVMRVDPMTAGYAAYGLDVVFEVL